MALLEIVAYSHASALAAAAGGADRIELCENSAEGGTTPSLGTIEAARRIPGVRLHVMIRPRGGDFLYTDDEYRIMLRDAELARQAGADGIVIGILRPDATVDVERCRRLVDAAGNLSVTFHRAFDWAADPLRALEDVIGTGCNRILTSGQAPSALAGAPRIATLVKAARGRITLLAGAGVNEHNVREIVRLTGVTEVHGSLRGIQATRMEVRPPDVSLGAPPDWPADAIPVADIARVRAVRLALDQA
ncbi:MAG: copper homeostasis protein CutC [Opitutales bacterium]